MSDGKHWVDDIIRRLWDKIYKLQDENLRLNRELNQIKKTKK